MQRRLRRAVRLPTEWVSCAPSGPCWAGGNQLIGSHEGFASALLMTPAAGSSTVSIYTAAGQNGPGVTTPSGLYINDIACPPGRTCYTADDGGVILRTMNGTKFPPVKTPPGRSWTASPASPLPTATPSAPPAPSRPSARVNPQRGKARRRAYASVRSAGGSRAGGKFW
jgi:hypothetical protein